MGIVRIEKKYEQARQPKLEHGRGDSEMVRKCSRDIRGGSITEDMEVGGSQKAEGPKLRWRDVLQKDMKKTGVKTEARD